MCRIRITSIVVGIVCLLIGGVFVIFATFALNSDSRLISVIGCGMIALGSACVVQGGRSNALKRYEAQHPGADNHPEKLSP
jgi:hypothetical protein